MKLRANIVGIALTLPLAAGVGYAVGAATDGAPEPTLPERVASPAGHGAPVQHGASFAGLDAARGHGVAAVDEYVVVEATQSP